MFRSLMNFSKCKKHFIPLIILLCTRCFCTTAAFIVTPKRIVAGIDRLVVEPDATGHLVRAGTAAKIALLRDRFIVACIGLEKMRTGRPDKQAITYDFPSWIKGIEAQTDSGTSVSMLADIVEREMTKTFTQTVPIETMMRTGALRHAQALDRFLVQFVVSGFDRGVVTLIELYYELDWQNNLLIGPTRLVHLPNDEISTALYVNGLHDAIDTDKLRDPNSYAHRRMDTLVPAAFKKMLALKPTNRVESIRAVRALITIEAETKPCEVGSGATVIVLPSVAKGTVMEYQHSLTAPKTQCGARQRDMKTKPH